MNPPTFDSKWNPKRDEVTYRIGKKGVNAFLLYGIDDLKLLHSLIGKAIEGAYDNATG